MFYRTKFIHKSHNAPVSYPTIYHLEKNVLIFVLNGALWDTKKVQRGIYEIGLLENVNLVSTAKCLHFLTEFFWTRYIAMMKTTAVY